MSERALDPLGLSRLSESIVNELLPGFTSLTNRGRNYSFYAWAIRQANSESPRTVKEFNASIARLEAAYVLSGILDAEESFPGAKGPIGERKAKQALDASGGDFVNVDFSVLANPAGGFGQYYRNSMSLLGLTLEVGNYIRLTNRGEELADSYREAMQDTSYNARYLVENNVPLEVLREYGQRSSYLRLKDTNIEREYLLRLLVDKNQNRAHDPTSRRNTIRLILELHSYLDERGATVDDDIFRDFVFYRRVLIGEEAYSPPEIPWMERALKEWRLFQFQEYFALAMENILMAFIEASARDGGITRSQFLKEAGSSPGMLVLLATREEIAETEAQGRAPDARVAYLASMLDALTIEEAFRRLLGRCGLGGPLSKKASAALDKALGIDHELSEANISSKLRADSRPNTAELVHNSLLLLLVLMARYIQYQDEIDEDTSWVRAEEERLSSVHRFIEDIRGRTERLTIQQLMGETLEQVITLHDAIAFEKLGVGNDTFRFEERGGGRYEFKREYRYGKRNNRFDTIQNVLEDLGVLSSEGERLIMTDYGWEVLRTYG